MKQHTIIQQMPQIFAKTKGIQLGLLIGSFARGTETSRSDMDYSILVTEEFLPEELSNRIMSVLPNVLRTNIVVLKSKLTVYFNDCPKMDICWYTDISGLDKNFLGSEIKDVSKSIAYISEDTSIDIEKYLQSISQEKREEMSNENWLPNRVHELTNYFIYEFEMASDSHKRSDSYKFYYAYNIALHAAIQLDYLSRGFREHYYLPKRFNNIFGSEIENSVEREQKMQEYYVLSGTLFLPEANRKKRELLTFFYQSLERLGVYSSVELNDIKMFLEKIYVRDYMWNFRDAATHYQNLRPCKIFRSSSLTRYQDEPFFADFISMHHITKVVDLRANDEYDESPYSEKSQQLLEVLRAPIDPRNQDDDFCENYHYGTDTQIAYRHFAIGHRHIYKLIFESIDWAEDVVVVHCFAGKDRTGSMIALLGLLVGETMDDIRKEYFESEMDTEWENLSAFMQMIEDEGGVEKFLLSCNISEETISKCKNNIQKT